MITLNNDAYPRHMASRIRTGLKRAGHPCTLGKSLEMAAHVLGRPNWGSLKQALGPDFALPHDDEIGREASLERRVVQISCLVSDGVLQELATQLIDAIRPTARRSRIESASSELKTEFLAGIRAEEL